MSVNNLSNISQLRLNHDLQLHNTKDDKNSSFSEVLNSEIKKEESVQFSKHALMRMNERGLSVSDEMRIDLEHAIGKAKQKGARDVVIIGQESAFVVNIPNNTVVTTMSSHEMKDRVFTNIDSAVLL